MADTFRALCQELVELSAPTDSIPQLAERLQKLHELANRARAALEAQPEPQGPSDQELDEMFTEVDQGGECQSWRAFARAVLARWGRPAIEPMPVSERPILKSSPFNNSDGHCWCGTSDFIDEHGDCPVSYPASWELREPCSQDDCVLPHWALPVPKRKEEQ